MTEPERPPSSMKREDSYDDDDDFEKELQEYIKTEESKQQEDEKMEKGEAESKEPMKKENRQVLTLHSDNEDSELDDYNLTEDQKRALEELDNLKTELGYPDEDPPEYNVKERLKVLNEDLKNDPTPVEKQKDSKVVFKPNLVDLVAPPPDFSDDEEGKNKDKKQDVKQQQQGQHTQKEQGKDKHSTEKDSNDKVDSKSEPIASKKSHSGNSKNKDKVLIEIDGQFQLVDSDDVRARDLGIVADSNKENQTRKSNVQPTPPGRPRPATATNGSRRNLRTTQANQRPQSANVSKGGSSPLDNFNYNSPYALSPREKQLMEERKKALEKHKQDEERRRKEEDEKKERENRDCFESWLKKKRETDRRKRIEEEDTRQKNDRADRHDRDSGENEKSPGTPGDFSQSHETIESTQSDNEENEAAFKGWLKEKQNQVRKEKLLKKRQEQEMHDGYYVRSREECDKAYKQWLKQKAIDARRARAAERQKAKLQRLAARRSRKSITLGKAIKDSSSFRYVDYYGYRF